jgi:protein involved in polysaccharide export with SLBB domain
MRMIQRLLAASAALLLAVLCVLTPNAPLYGQVNPTPEQLDIFKSLTPEQQDAILNQLGGVLGGGASAGTLGGGTSTGAGRQTQQDQQRNAPESERTSTTGEGVSEEVQPRFPALRGEDWVIIEIDYSLPPRPIPQSLQALYLAQGVSATQVQAQLQAAQLQAPTGQPAAQPGQPPVTSSILPPEAAAAAARSAAASRVAPAQLTPDEKERIDQMMLLIRSRNPYQLSREGFLTLPGFPPIALAGLNDDDATLRLRAEPAFSNVDIRLTHLPLRKTGPQALKPFGYDLFDRPPSTFAPVTNVPVPADYVVGPGDQLEIQLFGSQNRVLRMTVGRDGRISFPELGPINVGGQLFSSVRALIESRVSRQMIGVRASVAMGDTRSIRVFVVGDARRPGSYVISGLSTITSALFAAGGVKPIGSLRNILLKRGGAIIRRLDLYDLLLRGDTRDDSTLLPGDVIFIPPVGATVSADGEVRRPAIYEVRNGSTLGDLIDLAGGVTAEADWSKAALTRIDDSQRRVVLPVDIAAPAGRAQLLRDGDILRLPRLRPTLDAGIQVLGHVYTPGAFAYRDGLRLTDVIHSIDDLRPDADLHYLLIRRELPPDRHITAVSADLSAALAAPGSKADLELLPRDRITVFDLASGRDHTIQPLMDELRVQGNLERPTQVVHVDGRVRVPGDYPLETGMTLTDLLRAGGGLAVAAYTSKAELTRYEVVNGETRRTQLIEVDLAAALRGDTTANIALRPFDNLSIKEVSEWRGQESVMLSGEVRFPGAYSIRRGETLSSVISRAGGLTAFAFPEGAVFTRVELRRREQEQLDALTDRMQKDLAILAIQASATSQATSGSGAAAALSIGQQLFTQLRAARAVGRLVIDLNRTMHATPGSSLDVILRNGDELMVPRYQQEVTVIGEVQNATSHLYSADLSRNDYIALSGGVTRRADQGSIYVVRANGSVVANQGNRWFEHPDVRIKPGDTVVVPLNAEHLPPLPYWQAVTTILYNLAIAVAAVHAL